MFATVWMYMHQPRINPWVDYFQSPQFYIINQPTINPSYISAIYKFPECSRTFQNSLKTSLSLYYIIIIMYYYVYFSPELM